VNDENNQGQNEAEEQPKVYQLEISRLWQRIGYTLKEGVHHLKNKSTLYKNLRR